MADPKAPVTAPSPAPEPKAPVSVQGILDTAAATRQTELEDLTGVKRAAKVDDATPAAAAAPEAGTPPAPSDEFDFAKEWGAVPERLREAAYSSFYNSYNAALTEQYGDLLPLVVEAQKNPNLRATLAAAAQDPELLKYLGDPAARDQIKDLTKKELREFLFGDAKATYNKYAEPAAAKQPDTIEAARESLRAEFDAERDRTTGEGYVTSRQTEMLALRSRFGFSDGAIAHVVKLTEERFENAALRAGIDTRNPNWVGTAIRRGIKPPSYADAGGQYAEILGRTPPPAAPATSPATAPSPQAPRDAIEGKKAGIRALQAVKSKNPAFQGRRT